MWMDGLRVSYVTILQILIKYRIRDGISTPIGACGYERQRRTYLDHEFLPGTDMMGEIREGPYVVERLEMELALRSCFVRTSVSMLPVQGCFSEQILSFLLPRTSTASLFSLIFAGYY